MPVLPQLQPPDGTGATFLGSPLVLDIGKLDADFAIVGVPFGVPYGIRQVHYGPADAPCAIRERSLRFGRMADHYDFDIGCSFAELGLRIADCGDVTANPRRVDENASRAVEAIRGIVARKAVPVVLGGDDSISAMAIGGLDRHAPVTVVQIDAHIDYRDEIGGIRNGYSSPMRRAAEMPWVDRIVHVGTRGVGSARPQDVADTLARGNKIVTAAEIRGCGVDAVLEHVPAGANVHVVIDCDGVDPSVMPGTSAPVPGGLSYADVSALFLAISRRARVVGFNMAEHYPALDVNGITALAIVRLIVTLMAGTRIASRSKPPIHAR